MPATSSAPGAKPQSVKVKRKSKSKPPPTTTVNAELGGAGVAATERAASRAERDVTPPEIEAVASGKSVKAVKRERKARKERQEAAALKKLLKAQKQSENALRDLGSPEYNVDKYQRIAERDLKKGKVTPDPEPMSAGDLIGDKARDIGRHGVVGESNPKLAALGRELAFGSKNPTVAELAVAVAPVPAFKAAKVGQTILRGRKVLKTAEAAADATKAAKAAKAARKTERGAARAAAKGKKAKVKATADQFGKQAKSRLAKEEAKAAAKRTAARAADKTVRSVTSPVVAGMAASPGEVGDRTRAFIEGTAKANVGKSTKTTLAAVPGMFAYGATLASTLPAAATGNTKPLSGALHQGVEGIKALEPYISGDAEAVKQATEEEAGYVLAPLAPRTGKAAKAGAKALARTEAAKSAAGAAKAAARGIAKPVKAARNSKPVTKVAPKRPPRARPNKFQELGQVIKGHGDRKKMGVVADRTMGKEGRSAAMSAKAIDKAAAKFGRRHGPEAESLAVVMHVHGVSNKNTMAQLEAILDNHKTHPDDPHIANERKAIEWAQKHPEVFEDKGLWNTLDRMREHTDPIVTSESAKFVNQGRVAGVVARQDMVPAHARGLTDAATREGAWADVNELKAEARELKTKAREARARAKEAPNVRVRAGTAKRAKGTSRRQRLLQQAKVYERAADRRQAKADELQTILEPYARPGSKPSTSTKRIDWDAEMNERYIENVRASRHPDANDPGWASDKTPHDMVGDLGGPQVESAGPRVPRKKSGSAGEQDIADRSFVGFLQNSVLGPRMQRGVNEFIRGVVKEFKVKIPGTDRYVVKSAREANELIADGLVNPRTHVFVPIRHVKQSVKAEKFDLGGYHSELMDSLKAEIDGLESQPGTSYVLMKRDNAVEFADQLNPHLQDGPMAVGANVASRAILGTNPAWLEAQFVNELTQANVAVNPYYQLRGRLNLYRFGKEHPRAAEDFRAYAGDSPSSLESLNRTHDRGVPNPADAYDAYRYSRRTPVGKFLDDLLHLRTLGKIDRAKSGVIRSNTLAAAIHKDLNSLPGKARREVTHFFRGLAGMQDIEYRIAKELQGLSPAEQLRRFTEDPKLHDLRGKHLDYLDDVMGNWQAFTRFERKYSHWVMFYPYVRMSMRWTFSGYPKNHPIKAELLYLLGQQNEEELTKLLGHKPDFYQSAFPVVYGDDGKVDGVLPGGARFGAPGGNVLLETVNAGDATNLVRGLNPIAQAAIGAVTGINTYTGDKERFEGSFPQQIKQRGLAAARSLLSLPGPIRTGIGPFPDLSRIGEGPQSNASKGFDSLDPNKDLRSILNPFAGQSAQDFHDLDELSRDFENAHKGPDNEVSQLYDMVDVYGYDKTAQLLKRQMQGKVGIAKSDAIEPYPETDDPRMDDLIALYFELKDKTSKRVKRAGKPKVRPRKTTDSIFSSGGKPLFDSSSGGDSIFSGPGGQPIFK